MTRWPGLIFVLLVALVSGIVFVEFLIQHWGWALAYAWAGLACYCSVATPNDLPEERLGMGVFALLLWPTIPLLYIFFGKP